MKNNWVKAVALEKYFYQLNMRGSKMNTSRLVLIALFAFVAPQLAAKELPALVAKNYSGAVAAHTKAGKIIPCGDAFCFLTKDPITKVREFYAREGVKLGQIMVNKNYDGSKSDGLADLDEVVNFQLDREEIGSIYAAPVEYQEPPKTEGTNENEHFNAVIVISGKGKQKLQGSAQANKAAIIEDRIFSTFALTPESAQFQLMMGGLAVDPDRLIPLYNKHIALQGAFFQEEDGKTRFQINLGKLIEKRNAESYAGQHAEQNKDSSERREKRAAEREDRKNMTIEMRMQRLREKTAEREQRREQRREKRAVEQAKTSDEKAVEKWGTQDDRIKVIDAFLDEMEKEIYSTLIVIERSEKGTIKDPAIVQKRWRETVLNR